MGQEKREIEEREEAWNRKAAAEELRCSVCSQRIPYGDREIFFSTSMCGYCAHQAEKDD